MNLKFRQISTLVLMLGWLFSQNILLAHEYSSEHLIESHVCLAQISDNDDLMIGETPQQLKTQLQDFIPVYFSSYTITEATFGFQARAPPISLV